MIADGKTSCDPEARQGIKYILEKKVRLTAGTHSVLFSLPEDNYSTEVEISLPEGRTSIMEFRPVYKTKRFPKRMPTFMEGIDKYEVSLNGQRIL